MKKFSSYWLIISVFVMPCVLNLEMIGCIVFLAVNIGAAFYTFKKYNPEYFL